MAQETSGQAAGTPAERLAHLLMDRSMTLSTAESCTGGLIAAQLTSVPGVSAVYAGGFVTYATKEKAKMLGVPGKVLKEQGAVAKKTARLMAEGAAKKTGTDCAVSVTGNAVPEPMEDKPVGLVYIGCCIDGKATARKFLFSGSRNEIREQAADAALDLLYHKLRKKTEKTAIEDTAHEQRDAGKRA